MLASDVEWNHLNPARGDKAPQAATLWGDRSGSGATGFLLKPADGFSSPPHLHNVSYRGVVLNGLVHNDDPNAETTWMPAGSFWTQPKGQVHTTAAQGADVLAYIEVEEGPYLVLPTDKKFDSGERPLNVDASNVVWVDASRVAFVDHGGQAQSGDGPQVAFLWGGVTEGELRGHLVRLPAGFLGELNSEGRSLRAVVVEGNPQLHLGSALTRKTLDRGSYFSSTGHWRHKIASPAGTPTVLYVRSDGPFCINGNSRSSSAEMLPPSASPVEGLEQ